MTQWRGCLPLINVAWVRFGLGVTCWLSLLFVLACLQGFFSRFSGFPPFTATNISKFQFDQDRRLARKASIMWLPLKYYNLNANEKCLPLMLLEHLRFLDRFQVLIRCDIYLYSVLFYWRMR